MIVGRWTPISSRGTESLEDRAVEDLHPHAGDVQVQATEPLRADRPAVYRIKVQGELGEDWARWFTDGQRVSSLVITVQDGVTALTGIVADQSALHCLLNRVCDLGLALLSVCYLEAQDTAI